MLRAVLLFCLFASSVSLVACGGGSSNGGGSSPAPGTPQLSVSSLSLTFTGTTVGSSSAAQTISLTNSGSASLSFTSIVLADTTNFSLTNNCSGSLAVGSACTLSVVFKPQSAAALSSTITITDNASGSPQTVTLSGAGTAVAAPSLTATPASLSFGESVVGSIAFSKTVTLSNSGSAPLTFGSGISIADTTNFQLMNACGTEIDPRNNTDCTLSVAFQPQTKGTFSTTVNIANNAVGAPQSIAVSGTGVAALTPTVTLSTNAITFPSTTVGATSAPQSVTLTNTGTGDLLGVVISVTGADSARFSQTSNCGTSLPAGISCTINATFTPADAKTYTAAISIADNATGSPQTVGLSGTGAAVASAEAVLSPLSLTFPDTLSGTTSTTQTMTLSNPGSAPLGGINISIGGGTASTAYTESTTCGVTLNAGQNCAINVTFSPGSTGNYLGTLTVTDNASSSPQTASLSGNGIAPNPMLSANAIGFPTATVGTTTNPSSVTLTNKGSATLNITGITLGGADAANFAETTTCGATLAPAASCAISATFSPAAATTYSGTITVATNAGSPLTISLSGTGSTAAVTRTLYTFPESDNSVTPLYALVQGANKTIDMTMYALQDTTFTNYLVAACKRGVTVRVVLDGRLEKSANAAAIAALNPPTAPAGCSAVYANTYFNAVHQKTITIDGTTTAIMSLNLQSKYYSTTRDFALVENDTADIAAIQATFNQDYAAGNGGSNQNEFNYKPTAGDDLIWSPTTAKDAMTNIIANAQKTLVLENEELASSASYIVSALSAACQRGVVVHFAIVYQSDWKAQLDTIKAAGCSVRTYPDTTTGFYIHAKAVVADYGLPTQSVYMGSINYSNASMTQNRELGLYVIDPAIVNTLNTTMTSDFNGGTAY